MIVEQNVPLQAHNSFGIVAKARALVRVRGEQDLRDVLADPTALDAFVGLRSSALRGAS